MNPLRATLLVTVFACLSSSCNPTPRPADAATDGGGDAATPAWRRVQFDSDEYVLQPGEEKYICYTMRVPADAPSIVTSIESQYGPGTHHIFFGYTLVPEPEAAHECRELFRETWVPMFLGGVETPRLQMPAGVGMRLPPNQQIFMQLHLQSTSATPIRAKTGLTLLLGNPADNFIPAGIFGLDHRDINIPARADNAQHTMSCQPNRDMNVFGVLGHMHKYGRRIEVMRGGLDSTDMLLNQNWTFLDQPIVPVTRRLSSTDTVSLRCTHRNTTDTTIAYGESSDTEMCATVLYYYPFDSLDGCIRQPMTNTDGGADGGDASPPGPMPSVRPNCARPGDRGTAGGVGEYCTRGGTECDNNSIARVCLADLAPEQGQNLCTRILCRRDSDCGAGARCIGDSRGAACFPETCLEYPDAGSSDAAADSGSSDATADSGADL